MVNNDYGIYLRGSYITRLSEEGYQIVTARSINNTTLINNTANSNRKYGFYLWRSENNILLNNSANSNAIYGIYLSDSSRNKLIGNNAKRNNYHGILPEFPKKNYYGLDNRYNGIYLHFSYSNVLENNTISENKRGIFLDNSNNNELFNNTITHNNHGIELLNATFTRNNTIKNNYLLMNREGILLNRNNNSVSNNYIVDQSAMDRFQPYFLLIIIAGGIIFLLWKLYSTK